MNNIKKYINEIFENYTFTEEIKEFYDEIMQNCEERYADNIAHGMSQE